MAVACGKPTPAGPCSRPVSVKGAPCGVTHTAATSPTAAAEVSPATTAADPFAQAPQPPPAALPADPDHIAADVREVVAKHLGLPADQVSEPVWSVVYRDGQPSLQIEVPGVAVTADGMTATPGTKTALPATGSADAPTGVMVPLAEGGQPGGEPMQVSSLEPTMGPQSGTAREEPLTWDRAGFNWHTGDMTVWTREGYRVRYGPMHVDTFSKAVGGSRLATGRRDHHEMVQPLVDDVPVVAHDLPLDKGVTINVSSAAEAIEYDPSAKRLYVRYAGGKDKADREYAYGGVSHETFVRLVGSTSRGRFINDEVRGQHASVHNHGHLIDADG